MPESFDEQKRKFEQAIEYSKYENFFARVQLNKVIEDPQNIERYLDIFELILQRPFTDEEIVHPSLEYSQKISLILYRILVLFSIYNRSIDDQKIVSIEEGVFIKFRQQFNWVRLARIFKQNIRRINFMLSLLDYNKTNELMERLVDEVKRSELVGGIELIELGETLKNIEIAQRSRRMKVEDEVVRKIAETQIVNN